MNIYLFEGMGKFSQIATNLPRFLAGDTSATYIGESTDAAPTARPPKRRAKMKPTDVLASAVAAQERAKNRAQ